MIEALSFLHAAFLGYLRTQLQGDFAGLSWEGWLIILILVMLLVWWLISRQIKYSPSIDGSTFQHAEGHAREYTIEAVPEHSHEPPAANDAHQAPMEEMAPEPVVRAGEGIMSVPEPAHPEATPAPEKLEIIEGIGPKIASILHAAGIHTFAQLSTVAPAQLLHILHDSDLRLSDPSTWPEQARFAAAGDWEGLEKFQASLKAGRRIENM